MPRNKFPKLEPENLTRLKIQVQWWSAELEQIQLRKNQGKALAYLRRKTGQKTYHYHPDGAVLHRFVHQNQGKALAYLKRKVTRCKAL